MNDAFDVHGALSPEQNLSTESSSPVMAGAAMALSSVSVVTNALLLKRWRMKE